MTSDDTCLLFFFVICFMDIRDDRGERDDFDMGGIEMPTKTLILNQGFAAFTDIPFVIV